MTTRTVRHTTRLSARLGALRPLHYTDAPTHPAQGPHVRSASGLRYFAGALTVTQDDAAFLGRVAGDRVTAWPIDGPGLDPALLTEKPHKFDLESCVVAEERYLAFGSGSTAQRERVVSVRADGTTAVHDAHALYAALRAEPRFSGSELNVEGAIVLGGRLRLFNRGNGAPRGGLDPINATGDFELAALLAWLDGAGPLPPLLDVMRYELGSVGGVRLGFTDAAALPGGALGLGPGFVYLAGAEDSPDTYADGAVLGVHVGLVDSDVAVDVPVLDEEGSLVALKLEGVEVAGIGPNGVLELLVVNDADDPALPAQLGTLRVSRT